MIVNGIITILIMIAAGYLIGSIPTAYILTRITTGQDIRKLGGGNVGTLNTFLRVGHGTAILVALIDICKGVAAAALAHWVLHMDEVYVLAACAAVVVGHNWMVWLKFSGGKGMGVTAGALLVIMPAYGYSMQLWIIIGTVIVPFLLTRNVALAFGISVFVLPFLFWLGGTHSGMLVVWSIIVEVIVIIRFTPQALRALAKSKNLKAYLLGH